jgi:hypothetical protein
MYADETPAPAGTDQVSTPTRPKPRTGRATGHHALRRARSVEADRSQRARGWLREV